MTEVFAEHNEPPVTSRSALSSSQPLRWRPQKGDTTPVVYLGFDKLVRRGERHRNRSTTKNEA